MPFRTTFLPRVETV